MKSKQQKRMEAKQRSIEALAYWQSVPEGSGVMPAPIHGAASPFSNRDVEFLRNRGTVRQLAQHKIKHHEKMIQILSM